MKNKFLGVLLLFFASSIEGVEIEKLKKVLYEQPHPFCYDLHITLHRGNTSDENVLICCHGYGSNYSLADTLKESHVVPSHIIGFNFPDHDILTKGFNASKITFGSIQEILPLIYLLKRVAVDANAEQISLYGFSSGGGALVNTIAVLNSDQYDKELQRFGIDKGGKEKILIAIQKGVVLLDAPLKSMDEIIEQHAYDRDYAIVAQRYRFYQSRPIDSLAKWKGLTLSVVLFFQTPDQSLTNRDDPLFIRRLREYNPQGKTIVITRDEGGHCGFHHSLWRAWRDLASSK